ncbi:multiubiquitin domain-containing protein [Rhizobium beringeri]
MKWQNPHAETVEIFINTQPHLVPKGDISHAELVRLAYGLEGEEVRGYSVTYERGPNPDKPEDVLPYGGSIKVKKDMRFDVFPTGRS